MEEALAVACPCTFCDGEARETDDGELLPCRFCSTVCIPRAVAIGRWHDITRWRLHVIARGVEDDGAEPTTFVPEVLAGRYTHACRLRFFAHELDGEFARLCERDDGA